MNLQHWLKNRRIVAVILRATTKQGKRVVNCQDVSQSAKGGDKSRWTCQAVQSVLKRVSFVQGPVEVSHTEQERGVKEDKLDCYCVNCRVLYICCAIYLLSSIRQEFRDLTAILFVSLNFTLYTSRYLPLHHPQYCVTLWPQELE